MIVFVLIVATIFTYIQAREDYKEIAANRPINHKTRWRFRAMLLTIIGYPILVTNIWAFLIYIPLVAFYFWFLFDLLLNIFRKKAPFYIGYTAEIDVYFRRQFREMAPEAMFATKLTLLLTLLCLFLKVLF